MATKGEQGPLQVLHGHTDTHILIRFTRATDHVLFTPAEADSMIAAMQKSKEQLEEHKKKPPPPAVTAN